MIVDEESMDDLCTDDDDDGCFFETRKYHCHHYQNRNLEVPMRDIDVAVLFFGPVMEHL